MRYLSPFEKRVHRRRVLLGWCAVGLLFAVVCVLDQWLWGVLRFDPEKKLESKDWWQVLRQAGSVLPWAIVGLCLWLHDWSVTHDAQERAGAGHRGVMVVLAAALGGALAEVLKGISRRGRPVGDGRYHWGWTEDVGAYGLASSHAGVAFGGAIMMGWFFPTLRVPLLVLASGTAMTRLAVGAHYASDVLAAIVLSYAGCLALWKLFSAMPGGAEHPRTRRGGRGGR